MRKCKLDFWREKIHRGIRNQKKKSRNFRNGLYEDFLSKWQKKS